MFFLISDKTNYSFYTIVTFNVLKHNVLLAKESSKEMKNYEDKIKREGWKGEFYFDVLFNKWKLRAESR